MLLDEHLIIGHKKEPSETGPVGWKRVPQREREGFTEAASVCGVRITVAQENKSAWTL